MSEYVPTIESLSEIYEPSKLHYQLERYKRLVTKFREIYDRDPEFITRSPGRVNLIGEHIDYAGFGVLPMAIHRDVIIAVATSNDDQKVRVANINPQKFPPGEFEYEGEQTVVTIDPLKHEWISYFKCGYKGILKHTHRNNARGMYCLLDGSVPPGGGLSSSAAFICSAALATLTTNHVELTKRHLTQVAIHAEHYVGVNSGGMDQSASVFGLNNSALYVQFLPHLNVIPVPFPTSGPTFYFVIANSRIVADKKLTAPTNYNLRVVETRLAAAYLSKSLKLDTRAETLKAVMDIYYQGKEVHDEEGNLLQGTALERKLFDEMVQTVDKFLSKDGYAQKEMASLLSMDEPEFVTTYLTEFPVQTDVFRLYQRAYHVFTEARRVIEFRAILEEAYDAENIPPPTPISPVSRESATQTPGSTVSTPITSAAPSLPTPITTKAPEIPLPSQLSDSHFISRLGKLMNESQDSCRDLFNCSCPELDELCAIAIKSGALGSRLTGAGWGGCTVSLVLEEKLEGFMKGVKENYYNKRFPELTDEMLHDDLFASRPSTGSALLYGLQALDL